MTDVEDSDSGGAVKTGRPRDALLNKVSVRTKLRNHTPGDAKAIRYRCIGVKCKIIWTNRNRQRIFKHVCQCQYVGQSLRTEVNEASGNAAPSVLVEAMEQKDDTDRPVIRLKTKEASMDHLFGKSARVALNLKVNLCTLKLICAAGLPPTVVDRPEYKLLIKAANPYCEPASATTMVDSLIPNEAANVRMQQIKYLQNQYHLSISFDGGANRRHQSVYTFHITTADRRTFLMEGVSAEGEVKSGDWIFNNLVRVRLVTFSFIPNHDSNHHLFRLLI